MWSLLHLVTLVLLIVVSNARDLPSPPANVEARMELAEIAALGERLVGPNRDKFKAPQGGHVMNDEYIVSFDDGISAEERQILRRIAERRSGQVEEIVGPAFNGMVVKVSAIPDRGRRQSLVQALVNNRKVTAVNPNMLSQMTPNAPGLDKHPERTNQRLGSASLPQFNSTGAGVVAYGISSGIRTAHDEFKVCPQCTASRAEVVNFRTDIKLPATGDCNGFGTHQAGIMGGLTIDGGAKDVRLVGLVVANCSGWSTDSAVLSAINYVTKDCATRNHPGLGVTKKCVADFGIVYDRVVTYIDKAIDKSIKSGVVYAVPAGWRSVDACTSSPGSVTAALTVGALDWRGQPAWYSNYGPCVDLFADGDFLSAWHTRNSAYNYIDRMSPTHVAGAVARYLGTLPTPMTLEMANSVPAAIVAAAAAASG